MSTKIEWTDETWNPVTGCTKVSPGCDHCYAETLARRWWAKQYPPNEDGSPRTFADVRIHPDRLEQPLRWKRPRRVFVNSVSDMFHVAVPRDFLIQAFAVMALAPQHTFQILTKRPGRMALLLGSSDFRDEVGSAMCERTGSIYYDSTWPLPNVWLGVSVENQHYADTRIPELVRTPAAVQFLSCEPLLGPIDLHAIPFKYPLERFFADIDWVIVGGESGPGAQPMHPDWARSLRDQCVAAKVPFFFKQWGANEPVLIDGGGFDHAEVWGSRRVGKKAAGRELDGRTWDEWPA